ncbi:bifunctional precorrin-2 dehydrogenase/sirohydrochlorin ferrochelatase [Candidatus Omnitrophota bacterium]
MYPVFLKISGKPCVVVGGGTIAYRKVTELLSEEAAVTVVAEKSISEIVDMSEQGLLTLRTKRFEPSDVDNAYLVFAATNDKDVNAQVTAAAIQNKALINAVDTPELCDFYSGSVVNRGPLKIAISTGGCSPGIAGRIRRELEVLYPESYAEFIETIGNMRRHIIDTIDSNSDLKREALSWLVRKETGELFFKFGKERLWKELKNIISS